MNNSMIINFLYASILAGVPLLLGTIGEILTQKSGNLNLGVEGMMYLGAIFGFYGAYALDSIILSLTFGIIGGMAGALIYAFITVSLKADQNVAGLTLTIFGTGVANSIGAALVKSSININVSISPYIKSMCKELDLGFLSNIPIVGRLVFSHNFFVYIALFAALFMGYYLNHTRFGRNLRAVGENPAAADSAGIDVSKYKYIHILIGGGMSGIAGTYIALITCGGTWTHNAVAGQGWIAVALVIFASWKPYRAIFGSIIFGALSILRLYLPKSVIDIPPAIFSMLPFIVTSLVLVISSINMKKENQQPLSCGINYFREER